MNEHSARREFVTLRCPLCDWVSRKERVVADEPNGLWNAQSRLTREYHRHFDFDHRLRPIAMHGFYSEAAPVNEHSDITALRSNAVQTISALEHGHTDQVLIVAPEMALRICDEVESLRVQLNEARGENERVQSRYLVEAAIVNDLRAEVVRLQQALRDVLEVFSGLHDDCGCETCVYERAAVAAARAVLEGNQQ